jgi:hypothetical protein
MKWECVGPGLHVAEPFHIERGWGSYRCRGPHPMRAGGYCPGEQDHDDTRGWTLMRRNGDAFDILDRFTTLREAKGDAERIFAG